MQLVFPNVDGRPYEATNLVRRVLRGNYAQRAEP